MQVYQIVRYNFVMEIEGRTHRERTLGPRLDSTPEGAGLVMNMMLNNEGIYSIKRRVK